MDYFTVTGETVVKTRQLSGKIQQSGNRCSPERTHPLPRSACTDDATPASVLREIQFAKVAVGDGASTHKRHADSSLSLATGVRSKSSGCRSSVSSANPELSAMATFSSVFCHLQG